jgi:predicted phage baseplate assembly protein
LAAAGGLAAETLAHAIGRAIEAVTNSDRAVTLADYESLAMSTPGTKLARVAARANVHPSFPCLTAQGIITVIALPYLHKDQPSPGDGLKQAIANYLSPRRVIGTRVQVVGPRYKNIFVIARIKALAGADTIELKQRVIRSLNRFFHPLTGGQDNNGWTFGGDVFRSEVLQVIDETEGVDHVSALDLASGCGEPQCGNICLAADELVAAGEHQIDIL